MSQAPVGWNPNNSRFVQRGRANAIRQAQIPNPPNRAQPFGPGGRGWSPQIPAVRATGPAPVPAGRGLRPSATPYDPNSPLGMMFERWRRQMMARREAGINRQLW